MTMQSMGVLFGALLAVLAVGISAPAHAQCVGPGCAEPIATPIPKSTAEPGDAVGRQPFISLPAEPAASTASVARQAPGQLLWRFTNASGVPLQVHMFTTDKRVYWPNARTAWHLCVGATQSINLNCTRGQRVCFGAWEYRNEAKYWGAGFKGQEGCTNCCYVCGGGTVTLRLTR